MPSILHRLTINTSAAELYQALITSEGLSGWWTQADSQPRIGGLAKFVFGPEGQNKVTMEFTVLEENKKVAWKCVEGPWVETGAFEFGIEQVENGVVLKFAHNDWPSQDEFFMHCNSKWGYFFVVSLKQYLESGIGHPHPEDPSI